MPNNYEQITRTELHKLQQKVNKTSEELKQELKLLQDFQDIKEKGERIKNYWIGVCFIAGVIILNFILPYFIGSKFFSTSFNPKIGPTDIIALLIGGAFLWKGVRR